MRFKPPEIFLLSFFISSSFHLFCESEWKATAQMLNIKWDEILERMQWKSSHRQKDEKEERQQGKVVDGKGNEWFRMKIDGEKGKETARAIVLLP